MTVLRALPWVLLRSVRLIPGWHLGLGLVGAFALAASRRNPYPDDLVFGLRVGAVALAASAAFVFDDPAVNVMDGKPVPLSLQRVARLAVVLPAVAAAWWLLVAWMEGGLGPSQRQAMESLPRVALSLEFAALLGVVWAVATMVMRGGRDGGGTVATLALLAIVVGLVLLPERWAMFPSPAVAPAPGEAASSQWGAWVDAHRRWGALLSFAWMGVAIGVAGSTRRTWFGERLALTRGARPRP